MGCMLCGREIGPIRLLRDKEFCTTKHRQQYRERLNKALGQAVVSELRPAGIAKFVTRFSPTDVTHPPRAELTPNEWVIANSAPGARLPLRINSVAGVDAKRMATCLADRQFQPLLDVRQTHVERKAASVQSLPDGLQVVEEPVDGPAEGREFLPVHFRQSKV